MSYLEKFYFPRFGVERTDPDVPIQKVAQVLVAEYACKGVTLETENDNIIDQALGLTSLDNPDIRNLIADKTILWCEERWPISYLRITRMYPPKNDPHKLGLLVQKYHNRFERVAPALKGHSEIVSTDIGFQLQPLRDKLPILGVRGKFHNFILDGHHRTTIAVWKDQPTMNCLTAYRR